MSTSASIDFLEQSCVAQGPAGQGRDQVSRSFDDFRSPTFSLPDQRFSTYRHGTSRRPWYLTTEEAPCPAPERLRQAPADSADRLGIVLLPGIGAGALTLLLGLPVPAVLLAGAGAFSAAVQFFAWLIG